MTRVRSITLSLLLLAGFTAIYVASPIRTSADSLWSIHAALSLAEGKGGDLREYLSLIEDRNFYAIRRFDERYYTMFPIGVSLLAAPVVAAAAWLDPAFKLRISQHIPDRFEKNIASVYGAFAALLFFWLIYSRFPSIPIALATTVIFALGTSMWSTGTRALWQHGPLVLMLVVAMLLLVRTRQRPSLAQYASIPLAFAFVIRPTAAIPIAVLSAYVLIRHREWFIRFTLYGIAVAIPWVAYNVHQFGAVLPAYYLPDRVATSSTIGEAMLGNLISPARGMFVYSPVLLLSFTGFALALRDHAERLFAICLGAIVILHWLVVSRFPHWWAGHSYGPRFMTDIVPFLSYFVAFNFDAFRKTSGWKLWASRSCIALLTAVSIVLHGAGALLGAPHRWSVEPNDIDKNPARLWDWHDPQFARGWLTYWGPRRAVSTGDNLGQPAP
jgi:hypothetical protein